MPSGKPDARARCGPAAPAAAGRRSIGPRTAAPAPGPGDKSKARAGPETFFALPAATRPGSARTTAGSFAPLLAADEIFVNRVHIVIDGHHSFDANVAHGQSVEGLVKAVGVTCLDQQSAFNHSRLDHVIFGKCL